jgi:hypothetical protein
MILQPFVVTWSLLVLGVSALPSPQPSPKCRFSSSFTQAQILENPDPFISDFLYWEGHFHQNNVSYNSYNGMSYDGSLLDEVTGLATAKHPFSAASKESLQFMVYTHALAGSPQAARFLSPQDPSRAPNIAFEILSLKLKTYLQFNDTYPGFGGFLPWYTSDTIEISPTWDWVNRVPALDNGYVYNCCNIQVNADILLKRTYMGSVRCYSSTRDQFERGISESSKKLASLA